MPFVLLTGIDALIAKLSAPGARVVATEELARMGAPAMPYLVDAARGTWKNAWGASCEKDDQIRVGAVIALRKMGAAASSALPVLVELVSHPSALLRQELVLAFVAMKAGGREAEVVEACTAALVQLQRDPDPEVRFEADCALHGRSPLAAGRTREG